MRLQVEWGHPWNECKQRRGGAGAAEGTSTQLEVRGGGASEEPARAATPRWNCFKAKSKMCFPKEEVTNSASSTLLGLRRWSLSANRRWSNGSLDKGHFRDWWRGLERGLYERMGSGNWRTFWELLWKRKDREMSWQLAGNVRTSVDISNWGMSAEMVQKQWGDGGNLFCFELDFLSFGILKMTSLVVQW